MQPPAEFDTRRLQSELVQSREPTGGGQVVQAVCQSSTSNLDTLTTWSASSHGPGEQPNRSVYRRSDIKEEKCSQLRSSKKPISSRRLDGPTTTCANMDLTRVIGTAALQGSSRLTREAQDRTGTRFHTEQRQDIRRDLITHSRSK